MTIVKLGVVLFVAAIIFGSLEPTMLAQRVTGSSASMNTTIALVGTNTWAGLSLAVIGVVVVGAVIILRYVDFL